MQLGPDRADRMRSAWREALSTLRTRRRRALLSAFGVGLAAMMLATSVVVSEGLGGGFDRSAREAGLPDLIARFDEQNAAKVAARVSALPDVETFTTRLEFTNVRLAANGHFSESGVLEVIDPGRRGYAIVAGRDLRSAAGEIVVEQALARAWGVRVGSTGAARLPPDRAGRRPVGGTRQRRIPARPAPCLPLPGRRRRELSEHARIRASTLCEVWLHDPSGLDTTLEQARSQSYGLRGLRLTTRSGIRLVLDQAAGIVIALLVALSLIALITAGVMLAASSRAEVHRAAARNRRAAGARRRTRLRRAAVRTRGVARSPPRRRRSACSRRGLIATPVRAPGCSSCSTSRRPGRQIVAAADRLLGARRRRSRSPAPPGRRGGRPARSPSLLLCAAPTLASRDRPHAGSATAAPAAAWPALGARLVAARRARLARRSSRSASRRPSCC